jgi:hypothetical protein
MIPTKNFQIVIIDDDPLMETRPLYEELVEIYEQKNIILKKDIDEGLNFVKKHLDKRTIVILDYDFGSKRTGLSVFEDLQAESKLLYIILNTAKSIIDIPQADLKVFINNHLMALVDKTDGYEKTLEVVKTAIQALSNRVDCILEEWILRHEFYTREKPYMKLQNGKTMSLNELLIEIRQDTPLGRTMSSNIISTAITLIQRDIQKLDNTST